MISSMHHSVHVDEQTKKPEIIALYNSTKGGVDGLDHKIANYSSNRRTRRWPMAIFFTIIDVSAGVNAFVIHQTYEKTPRMKRMEFMRDLAFDLIKPFIAQRLQKGHLPRELSMSMRRILQIPESEAVEGAAAQEAAAVLKKRKTYALCPPKLKRQTKYPCQKCRTPIA